MCGEEGKREVLGYGRWGCGRVLAMRGWRKSWAIVSRRGPSTQPAFRRECNSRVGEIAHLPHEGYRMSRRRRRPMDGVWSPRELLECSGLRFVCPFCVGVPLQTARAGPRRRIREHLEPRLLKWQDARATVAKFGSFGDGGAGGLVRIVYRSIVSENAPGATLGASVQLYTWEIMILTVHTVLCS